MWKLKTARASRPQIMLTIIAQLSLGSKMEKMKVKEKISLTLNYKMQI
jgi:hypothetical protein